MNDLASYVAGLPDNPGPRLAEAVRDTPEFRRIRDLPRREWEGTAAVERLRDELTRLLRTDKPIPVADPPIPSRLLPAQAMGLMDGVRMKGAFIPLVTGGGKTLLSFLLPTLLGAKRALLLVPKRLVKKTKAERLRLAPYWKIGALKIVNYELLPHRKTLIEDYNPDLLILDEAHALKNRSSARCKIVGVWRKQNRNVPVVPMSGSFMHRDLRNFAHLLRWALGDSSPLPRDWVELEEWSYATGSKIADDVRVGIGALAQFPVKIHQRGNQSEGAESGSRAAEEPVDRARRAVGQRIAQTPGVVCTASDMPSAGLLVSLNRLPLDARQKQLIHQLIKDRRVPDGEYCDEPLALWRHMRTLAVGMWQHWDPAPPKSWLDARKAWAWFCSDTLARSRTLHCPMDVAKACKEGKLDDREYKEWCAVRRAFVPNTVTEWISETTVDYCVEWLGTHPRGIVWAVHVPFGERLSGRAGVPFYREGACDQRGQYMEHGSGPSVASVHACHEGLNLQYKWSDNLLSSPTTEASLEQWLSRTHRRGQTEDEVTLEVMLRCEGDEKAWTQALADAKAVSTTMSPRRLSIATYVE